MRKSRKKYAEDLGIRINKQIWADEVRVLTDDGENLGVMPTRDALKKAESMGLDLVEEVKVGTGEGDLMVKAKNISKWLKEGHRIKLELFLRGRIKYAEKDFLQERMERVLHFDPKNAGIGRSWRQEDS